MALGLGKAVAVNRNRVGDPYEGRRKQGSKPGYHPYKVLKGLETENLLTPEQLAAAARALTVLETKPEIHGYKQIATQLQGEKAREATGLLNLGTRAAGSVSGLYKGLAESAAQSIANQSALAGSLTAQSADIAKEGTANLAQQQATGLGDLQNQLQMRGAQDTAGGAQQALGQAVSAQQAYQQSQSQAAQQGALQQGAGSTALLQAMAGAAQMQGAESGVGIRRDIANRVAESNAKYNTNIQTALGKLGEAKSSYGSKYVKNLLGLREGEQKFKTAEQAVAGEKAGLALKQAENAEAAQQQGLENERAANKERREERGEQLNWKEFGLAQWKAHHPNIGEQAKKAKEVRQESNEVKALIGPLVATYGAPTNNKQLNQFMVAVNGKASADPRVVKQVVEAWFYGPHKQKEREAAGVGSSHR